MRSQDDGIFGVAIYPPTVLRGTARIRLSLNAGHTDTDVEHLVEAVRRIPGRCKGRLIRNGSFPVVPAQERFMDFP